MERKARSWHSQNKPYLPKWKCAYRFLPKMIYILLMLFFSLFSLSYGSDVESEKYYLWKDEKGG